MITKADKRASDRIENSTQWSNTDPAKVIAQEMQAERKAAGDMAEALGDAIRTMRTYGTANMGYSIERCESSLKAYVVFR